MDGAGDDVIGWTADGLASGVLGGAVGTCLLLLGAPQIGVVAAAVSVLAALALLRAVKPEPQRFRLPAFAIEAEAEGEALLELSETADDEAFLLEDRLDPPSDDSRVVQLFAPRPLPTPGELQQRIDAHLASGDRQAKGGSVLELEIDAS